MGDRHLPPGLLALGPAQGPWTSALVGRRAGLASRSPSSARALHSAAAAA